MPIRTYLDQERRETPGTVVSSGFPSAGKLIVSGTWTDTGYDIKGDTGAAGADGIRGALKFVSGIGLILAWIGLQIRGL